MQPYEIIGTPFDVYIAPVGESFPTVDTDPPGGNWTQAGTGGSRNLTDEGVSVQHNPSYNEIRGAGVTGPQKAFRTEEELIIIFSLMDLTLEQYAEVLNSVSVTEVSAGSGTIGTKAIDLYQGLTVNTNALLIRGPSPYDESFNLQYEIPRVYHAGSPEVIPTKGGPAELAFEYHALIDLNASTATDRFGKIITQHEAALA